MKPMAKLFLLIGALNGALVVLLGAFGAHGLKGTLSVEMLRSTRPECNIISTIHWAYWFWACLRCISVNRLC